ncbi:uncharacterized protein MONOS_1667 [Monocercomonoides exilis]|uniref:uncharacterized protein n=1 Tax=Monocercomonoides exilis TaxID=2049356 RepID=UPI00355A5AED|nr:hypothetical protein MONOS_1667 [Monocercomonoides exilis]|eukprot:MONOS_1667.1-p1 / transcript=MONOS_1667.1 / gene=MONOS_1667 / organism=Monocercomonoides_exilis_PA203 / gene_product=unspecified product / transcript_product=unspecified product / location=Mono_scaffold00031:2251-4291(-) / protein_length=438 / sequence_SO=supercontig / SO=protein_coding / is_pseudo=false
MEEDGEKNAESEVEWAMEERVKTTFYFTLFGIRFERRRRGVVLSEVPGEHETWDVEALPFFMSIPGRNWEKWATEESAAEEAEKGEFKLNGIFYDIAQRIMWQISEGKGRTSVNEFYFSSFCQYFASPSIHLISLSQLTFFNISTAPDLCSSSATMSTQTTCFMSSCSFTSVCEVYDGGIVPSLSNPLTSLTTSNSSFVGCCRTRNVVCEGTEDNKKRPERQSMTENIANTFTWCEWSGSKATGNVQDGSDSGSNGGAIYMHNLKSGEMFVSHCAFNDCYASWDGGAIMAHTIKSVDIRNNFYNSCIAQNQFGGGIPFYESYTTNSNDTRVCRYYNCQYTEKKGWLKEGMKDRYVGVSGNDANNLCGMSESAPCKTVGHAVSSSIKQPGSAITRLVGRHVSEGTTIRVGEKKISIMGKGRNASVIGMNSLSSSSTTQ